jgi:DNA-binding transcriptional LysR family regulator
MRLELRHLQIVCAIADHGSVTKAASALGLAQPALTAQLQRIERSLGGPLFERDRRGARPTALGDLVLSRARIVLPAVEGLQEEVTRLATDRETRCYRIGATNGPILSGLVHRLTAADPHAHLSTHSSWSSVELADMLAAGRLDYVLVGVCGNSPPPSAHDLAWRELAVDAVFVLLPEQHPLAGSQEVDLADLAEAHWVATPGGKNCFRDCFVGACARAGFAPRNVYEGDVRTCIELVEAGDAVALCQSSFRPPPGLVSVPIAGIPLRWRHLLGWHPDSAAAAGAEQVASYAVAAYQDAASRLPRFRRWLAGQPCFGAQSDDGAASGLPVGAPRYD